MEEGYVKFRCERIDGPAPKDIDELNALRTELHKLGLIGMYDNGIGFGNVSMRVPSTGRFIVTGTATGEYDELSPDKYCEVTSFNISKNIVKCIGKVDASSESMSHGAIFDVKPEVNCAIHVHSKKMWDHMLANEYPFTPKDAAYGTPEIAQAITSLVRDMENVGVFVMAGHEEGVISYGYDIGSARKILLDLYKIVNIR